jgi:hypothetical protein
MGLRYLLLLWRLKKTNQHMRETTLCRANTVKGVQRESIDRRHYTENTVKWVRTESVNRRFHQRNTSWKWCRLVESTFRTFSISYQYAIPSEATLISPTRNNFPHNRHTLRTSLPVPNLKGLRISRTGIYKNSRTRL